jgi:excisionase family DNA binding protein
VTRRHPDVNQPSFAPTRDGVTPPVFPASATAGSRLLEVEDVANYLGVRTDWVYREVRAGRLPHIRLGRAVRFRRESIEAWVDSRERGVAARRRP